MVGGAHVGCFGAVPEDVVAELVKIPYDFVEAEREVAAHVLEDAQRRTDDGESVSDDGPQVPFV